MGPLTGLKVLDLTGMVSGPVAAMMLADQGAEVIKVEPISGELVRHMAAPHNGINPVFFSCNRGNKSIALDKLPWPCIMSKWNLKFLLFLSKKSIGFLIIGIKFLLINFENLNWFINIGLPKITS